MDAILEATKRDTRGKNEARRLRVAGRIPAVIYGARTGSAAPVGTAVAVNPKELMKILRSESGANTLISLRNEDGESKVMIREYQIDPVTHHLLHADFYQLAMDKEIQVTVPVQVTGIPVGVKLQGGMLDFLTREIHVMCLPTQIPEHVTLDVSELALNGSIRVRDLPANAGWRAVTDGDTMIVHVVSLKAEESAAAAATEPEVAKKGKTDKPEESAAKKK